MFTTTPSAKKENTKLRNENTQLKKENKQLREEKETAISELNRIKQERQALFNREKLEQMERERRQKERLELAEAERDELKRVMSRTKFPDGTTREHSTYDGEMIKQADCNLLGFPLQFITDPKEMLQDLKYYEHKIDPKNGPAMSYSVFAVQKKEN